MGRNSALAMKRRTVTFPRYRLLALSAILCGALFPLHADPLIIPHIADGAGWKTTLVLTNTSTSAATVTLVFHQETANSATEAWNLAFEEVSSTSNLNVPGGATVFLHTTGTSAGANPVGWGELQTTGAIQAYAVFTSSATQEGTASAATGASRLLIPFDNTGGRTTAIALAADAATAQSVTVSIRTNDGTITHGTLPTLPADGHTSFLLAQQFPATASQGGLLEVIGSVGSLAGIALRFNANGAFTSAPVYPQSGTAIVGVVVNAVQVSSLTFAASSVQSGGSVLGMITLNAAAPAGGTTVALSSGSSAVTVPATVTVPAGDPMTTFTATGGTVTTSQAVTITAQAGGQPATASLTVSPASAGTLVFFTQMLGTVTFQPVPPVASVYPTFNLSCSPGTSGLTVYCQLTNGGFGILTLTGTSSDHGKTFVFTQLNNSVSNQNYFTVNSQTYTVVAVNLSIALTTPAGVGVSGSVTGTLSMSGVSATTNAAETLSGTITGNFFSN
jgi:hypothetical protein